LITGRRAVWGKQFQHGELVALIRQRMDKQPNAVLDRENIVLHHQIASWLVRVSPASADVPAGRRRSRALALSSEQILIRNVLAARDFAEIIDALLD
jgi:hypothetical protein